MMDQEWFIQFSPTSCLCYFVSHHTRFREGSLPSRNTAGVTTCGNLPTYHTQSFHLATVPNQTFLLLANQGVGEIIMNQILFFQIRHWNQQPHMGKFRFFISRNELKLCGFTDWTCRRRSQVQKLNCSCARMQRNGRRAVRHRQTMARGSVRSFVETEVVSSWLLSFNNSLLAREDGSIHDWACLLACFRSMSDRWSASSGLGMRACV
jgi:hypothetical protein